MKYAHTNYEHIYLVWQNLFKQMVHHDSDIVNDPVQLEYLCMLAAESQ